MNTSQFMDKQIMEFSGLQQPPQPHVAAKEKDDCSSNDDDGVPAVATAATYVEDAGSGRGDALEEEIVPSYDFQQIRTPAVDSSSPPPPSLPSVAMPTDSPSSMGYGLPETHESPKFVDGKGKDGRDAVMLEEIDRAVKKYADNLLYSLEGISSRLSQLETRSRKIEVSIDELKLNFEDNVGSTDGKLRHLEGIVREVQTGLQFFRENRESLDVQPKPTSQSTIVDHRYLNVPALHSNPQSPSGPPQSFQNPPPNMQQSFQQPPQPSVIRQQPPPLIGAPAPSAENLPSTPLQQSNPPVQFPNMYPSSAQQSFSQPGQPSLPPPSHAQEPITQRYQEPVEQTRPQILLPQQHYRQPPLQHSYQASPNLPPYSQTPPAQSQASIAHNPEQPPSYAQHPFSPVSRPTLASIQSQPPHEPLPHQFYRPNSRMHEASITRPGLGPAAYTTGYGTSPGPGFTEQYNYTGGSPSNYNALSMNPTQFSPNVPPSGDSNYQRLPTAKLLPQTAVGSGSGGGGSSGNRIPLDDVVEKVATMGFSREQVRATVKKLTENGQSVDLNVVLDKLMNG